PTSGAVSLRWASPAAGSTVSGNASFRLTGSAFRNVEIFWNGVMVARASVSSDSTTATASIETSQFANGTVTLTAHAWNSPPGTAFTSEADAGSLAVSVQNQNPGGGGGTPPGGDGAPDPGTSRVPAGYHLVFSDEFTGGGVDTGKWNTLAP